MVAPPLVGSSNGESFHSGLIFGVQVRSWIFFQAEDCNMLRQSWEVLIEATSESSKTRAERMIDRFPIPIARHLVTSLATSQMFERTRSEEILTIA